MKYNKIRPMTHEEAVEMRVTSEILEIGIRLIAEANVRRKLIAEACGEIPIGTAVTEYTKLDADGTMDMLNEVMDALSNLG